MNPTDRGGPIFSAYADDPASSTRVDGFVIALAERVDELQDCELRGKLGELQSLTAKLALESSGAGYDSLASCAEAVQSACRDGVGEAIRKGLEELTEIARRIRLGHRGAV